MDLGIKLFRQFWHLVGHRKELEKSGDFLKLNTSLGELVVFNDNGDYVAFDNKCPHRGALIYTNHFGNQANVCPYHGWSYSFGKLKIPNRQMFHDCQVDSAALNKYKLEWCGDFLFVGVDPIYPLEEQLKDVLRDIEDISLNIERRADFNFYEYECYWPLAIENALEPYHISMVHPNTLATLGLEDGINALFEHNSIWRANVSSDRARKGLEKVGQFFTIDYQYKGYMSIYMFPFSMLSSTYGYSYALQNFFPHQNKGNATFFHSRLLSAPAKSSSSGQVVNTFVNSSAKVNRQVFEEDHAICKLMPTESWNSDPLVYPSKLEEKIDHFRALCRKYG